MASRQLRTHQCAHQRSLICFYLDQFRSLNHGIPKNSGRRKGCYVFKFLRIWRTVSFMRRSSFIEQPFPVKPHLQQPVHCSIFLITRTLKQDDLAAAFSTTSLTELEQNYSSWLVVENNMSLFAENSKVFLFCLSIQHPKR